MKREKNPPLASRRDPIALDGLGRHEYCNAEGFATQRLLHVLVTISRQIDSQGTRLDTGNIREIKSADEGKGKSFLRNRIAYYPNIGITDASPKPG